MSSYVKQVFKKTGTENLYTQYFSLDYSRLKDCFFRKKAPHKILKKLTKTSR